MNNTTSSILSSFTVTLPFHCDVSTSVFDPVSKTFVILGLGLLNVTIVGGNLLILVAALVDRRLWCRAYVLYFNMVVADLVLGLVVAPPMAVYTVLGCWPFGRITCMIWAVVDCACSTTSFFCICIIAIERFICIMCPFQHRAHGHHRWTRALAIAFTWLLPFIMWVPAAFVYGWYADDTGLYYLVPTPTFAFTMVGLGHFFPALLTVALYIIMYTSIRKRFKHSNKRHKRKRRDTHDFSSCDTRDMLSTPMLKPPESTMGQHLEVSTHPDPSVSPAVRSNRSSVSTMVTAGIQRRGSVRSIRSGFKGIVDLLKPQSIRKDIRAAQMFGIIVAAFAVCWLPWLIVWPIDVISGGGVPTSVMATACILAYANSAFNPFLYIFTCKDFRNAVRKVVHCGQRQRRQSLSSS